MKKGALNRDLCVALDREDLDAAKELMALGADVNATSRETAGSTLLWLTVKAAGQELSTNFRELAAGLAGLMPNVPQWDHAAERAKHLRILRFLIGAKADVNKPCHGGTPLRIAVCGGDVEVVELLLASGANPGAETFSVLSNLARNTHPGYWNTVLHEAVLKGSLPIAGALLAAGADANRTDHEGKTPLTIARENGFEELAALLQGRTTAQSTEPFKAQATDDVWRAARDGRLSDLQQLIANGASIEAMDAQKATPLHEAAAAGQLPVVEWLLEHGVNLNAKKRDYTTPLLLAAGAAQADVVKLLVSRGVNVEAAERGGHTPFSAAVVNEHLEIAGFLLRHGANPDHRTEAALSMTPLMHVAGQKLLKAVEFLLQAGANVNLRDARGQNALHHAVSGAVVHRVVEVGPGEDLPEGPPEAALPIIQRLLAAGADPHAHDKDGKTPLVCARQLRLTEIASVLEKAGG